VVSVLATGSKGRGLKPVRGDGLLRAINIRSTPSVGWEVKPEVPCRKILQHVKRSVDVSKILNTRNSHSYVYSSYSNQKSLLVGLPASSSRQVRSYPQPASSSSPRLSTHIHPGDEQQARDGRGSETSVSPHHNQSIKAASKQKGARGPGAA
jgi:hypothetical protein